MTLTAPKPVGLTLKGMIVTNALPLFPAIRKLGGATPTNVIDISTPTQTTAIIPVEETSQVSKDMSPKFLTVAEKKKLKESTMYQKVEEVIFSKTPLLFEGEIPPDCWMRALEVIDYMKHIFTYSIVGLATYRNMAAIAMEKQTELSYYWSSKLVEQHELNAAMVHGGIFTEYSNIAVNMADVFWEDFEIADYSGYDA